MRCSPADDPRAAPPSLRMLESSIFDSSRMTHMQFFCIDSGKNLKDSVNGSR